MWKKKALFDCALNNKYSFAIYTCQVKRNNGKTQTNIVKEHLVRTTKSTNGVYKTNIDCSFIRGMVEIVALSVKFKLSLFFTNPTRFVTAID